MCQTGRDCHLQFRESRHQNIFVADHLFRRTLVSSLAVPPHGNASFGENSVGATAHEKFNFCDEEILQFLLKLCPD